MSIGERRRKFILMYDSGREKRKAGTFWVHANTWTLESTHLPLLFVAQDAESDIYWKERLQFRLSYGK